MLTQNPRLSWLPLKRRPLTIFEKETIAIAQWYMNRFSCAPPVLDFYRSASGVDYVRAFEPEHRRPIDKPIEMYVRDLDRYTADNWFVLLIKRQLTVYHNGGEKYPGEVGWELARWQAVETLQQITGRAARIVSWQRQDNSILHVPFDFLNSNGRLRGWHGAQPGDEYEHSSDYSDPMSYFCWPLADVLRGELAGLTQHVGDDLCKDNRTKADFRHNPAYRHRQDKICIFPDDNFCYEHDHEWLDNKSYQPSFFSDLPPSGQRYTYDEKIRPLSDD